MHINILREYTQDRLEGRHVEVEGKTYDIEVRYELGGMNWFSGNTEPRGVFLGVTPVQYSKHAGSTFKSYTAFSGIKILLQPMKRFNKQGFARIAYGVMHNLEQHPKVQSVLLAVINKNADRA